MEDLAERIKFYSNTETLGYSRYFNVRCSECSNEIHEIKKTITRFGTRSETNRWDGSILEQITPTVCPHCRGEIKTVIIDRNELIAYVDSRKEDK